MKKFLKILLYLFLGLLSLIVVFVLVYNIYFGILNSSAKSGLAEKPKLEVDGFSFRDLNNNGKLDVYEDSRQPVENRIEDLLSQMTLEQKAGQMWHPPIGVGQNGEVLKKPGFKSMNPDNTTVLPLKKGVKVYVENIKKDVAENYATVVDSLNDADFAILRLQAPWEPRYGDFIERFFHQGDLDFKEPERSRILAILQEKPTVVCMYLERPAVIPEIADVSVGLLAEFGAYDDAVLDIIFGNFNPGAKLPFELPSSMEAVKAQYEDVPYDSKNPLFPFGYGLRYEETK